MKSKQNVYDEIFADEVKKGFKTEDKHDERCREYRRKVSALKDRVTLKESFFNKADEVCFLQPQNVTKCKAKV